MDTKTKVIFVGLLTLLAFAIGRYTSPEKVKIQKEIVEVIKEEKETNKNKKVVIVEVTKPDGSKEKTTTITEDTTISQNKEKNKNEFIEKETTKESSKVILSALVGSPISFAGLGSPVYGAEISKDFIGPIRLGLWGMSNGLGGISVGLRF